MNKHFLKTLKLLSLSLLISCGLVTFKPIKIAAEISIEISAPAALLMEYQSGTIIYAKNEHAKLFPASMTKMMGLLLVMESLQKGTIQLADEVSTSHEAASMGGTQIFLEPGEKMSVNDLIKSIAINSANDAMFSLAEYVGGTEASFVKLMNNKAKSLGMKDTQFMNTTGFDDPQHYTSAFDMAILGRALLQYESTIIPFTSQYDGYVREDSPSPFWLVNTNKLVRFYEGMDGLKTGFTQLAGYCLTATAKRQNTRFIAVVMKASTIDDRSRDITKMLNYGFANYESVRLFPAQAQVATYDFQQAKDKATPLVTLQPIDVVVKKGNNRSTLAVKIEMVTLAAPIAKESQVGYINVVNADGWHFKYPIVVLNDVPILRWWDLFVRVIGKLFASL